MLNTRATKTSIEVYATGSGEELRADLVYRTVGGTPNTQFLRGSSIPLDKHGFIMVGLPCSLTDDKYGRDITDSCSVWVGLVENLKASTQSHCHAAMIFNGLLGMLLGWNVQITCCLPTPSQAEIPSLIISQSFTFLLHKHSS